MNYKKKKKYFFFPKLQLRHLLFLFFFIISFIKKGTQVYFEKNQRIAIEFLKLYMYDVGDFLSIIPFLIIKKRMQPEKEEKEKKIERIKSYLEIEYIYNNVKEDDNNNCITLRNVFLFTIFDFTAQIIPVIYYIVKEDQKLEVKQGNLNFILIFNVITIILFSLCFLHTHFYRHHLVAFLIDIFCVIVLTIIDLYLIFSEAKENIAMSIIYIFVKVLSTVLYSIENVTAKIIFLYNYVSTYALLFNKSIFHFVYLLIFSFPFFFKKMEDKNGEKKLIFSMIADIFEEKKYYFIVIGYTIISFFYNNLCQKIIDVFSPNHFAITRVLENFAIFLTNLIINGPDSKLDLIIRIIMYILIVFSTFIYNEFLVLNFCGLSKNTKLFLDYEAENETKNDGEQTIEIADLDNSKEILPKNGLESQIKNL